MFFEELAKVEYNFLIENGISRGYAISIKVEYAYYI